MVKITFFNFSLNLRGTTCTMYDFAFYAKKIYGWDIQILYIKNHKNNHESSVNRFEKEFDVYEIDCNQNDLESVNRNIEIFLNRYPSEYFYIQKAGMNDGVNPKNSKTCVLCCSIVNPKIEKHGYKYAFISNWLSKYCSNGEVPVVPSIVNAGDNDLNLRSDLLIPSDAIVFGRTGGMDTWDIPFVNESIETVLDKREDVYFIFQNTPKFFIHDRVFYINVSSDIDFKSKFINTCDALIHARYRGESFGLVCGEFSSKNKRVITYRDSGEKNHIEILKDKGLYYGSKQELDNIFLNFNPEPEKDWNCYKEFEPEKVMKIFKEVFIDG